MERCQRCGKGNLSRLAIEDSLEVAGHVFTTAMPARRCGYTRCGDVLIDAKDIREFEKAVVLALARAGERSGGVVKALRTGIGMGLGRLAELLDVEAETVVKWEEGTLPVPTQAAAMLRGLVMSRLGGGAAHVDGLALLRQPRQLAARIRVHLAAPIDGLLSAVRTPAEA